MTSRKPSDNTAAGAPDPGGPALVGLSSAIFKDVRVAVQARLGEVSLTVEEVLALKAGSVVPLDAKMSDLIPLQLNGAVIALGEIVAVDDNFGVRIVEVGPR